MKKRLIVMVMAIVLALTTALVACNKKDDDTPKTEYKSVNVVVDGDTKAVYLDPDKDSYTLDDFDLKLDGYKLVGFYDMADGVPTYRDVAKGVNKGETIYADIINDGMTLEEIAGTDTAKVVKYNGNVSKIMMPNFYNGKRVTRIEHDALSYKVITSIVYPFYLEEIGEGAFSNINAREIIIPKSVKVLEESVFAMSNIGNIIFEQGSNVESIGSNAFGKVSGIQQVRLPDKLTAINIRTFLACPDLVKVYIPNSVKRIDNYSFMGCTKLTIYRQKGGECVDGPYWNYRFEDAPAGSNQIINVKMVDDDSQYL